MSKKESKVKEFMTKYERGIRMGAAIVTTVCAGYIGYKIGSKSIHWVHRNDSMMYVLDDVAKNYKSIDYFCGINDDGVSVSDLGALGEQMIKSGAELEDKLTHFIAIGKGTNK